MFKTALLTLTSLVVCLSPAAAVETLADCVPAKRCILPHQPQVRKTVVVVLNGKMEVVDIRFEPCDALALATRVTVKINGRTFVINFDKKPDLLELACKLGGEMVEIEGTIKEGVVEVTSLKKSAAAKESIKETTRIEIEGRLDGVLIPLQPWHDPRFPVPYLEDIGLSRTEWQVVVDGTAYKLDLNAELLAKASNLDGKNVIVTGVLEMRTSWKYDYFGNKDELSRVQVPVIRVETLAEDLRRF